jgi:hypothetical protein
MGDFAEWSPELRRAVRRAIRSPAATLFLAAVVVFGAYWRVDVFIVDTVAVANALGNLADGSLSFAQVYFGPADAQTPGVYVSEGQLYGRNYGQVVAALPVLYLLEAVSWVAAPRLLLAGAWSLSVAVLGGRLATALGRPSVRAGGVVLATLAFLASAAFGTALAPRLFPLVALQTVTLLAAAGLVAVASLLVTLFHGRRSGVAAGVATLLLGPVAFWATIPKRHVITAFLVVLTAYLFARSRYTGRPRDRALAYLPVGLTAWVSAPEGFLLLVALAPVDLATSPRNDLRSLTAVAAVLAVSLLPFLATNAAVSGNPVVPPRMLESYRASGELLAADPGLAPTHPSFEPAPDSAAAAAGDSGGAAPADSGSPGSGGGPSGADRDDGALAAAGSLLTATATTGAELSLRAADQVEQGLSSLSPERLYHVFVRSGRIPGVNYAETGGETIDLTMLESAPLLAALLATPVVLVRRSSGLLAGLRSDWTAPHRATDLFALVFTLLFSLAHLPRLPLHSTVTVRYLVPVVPLLAYGVFRLTPVRRVVNRSLRTVATTALVASVAGAAVGVVALAPSEPDVGALMQVHAVANLAAGAVVVIWLVSRPSNDRLGAVAVGLLTAAMALFLVGTGFEYFAADRQYLLPVARLLEAGIPILH